MKIKEKGKKPSPGAIRRIAKNERIKGKLLSPESILKIDEEIKLQRQETVKAEDIMLELKTQKTLEKINKDLKKQIKKLLFMT